MKYTIDKYKSDIDELGLEKVWENIIESHDVDVENYGELYEIGLARVNKDNKKEKGVYYTPKDVADVISSYLLDLKGDNICDVCCGTGNLILSYLKLVGEYRANELINSGKIYLYDMDSLALKICKASISLLYKKADVSKLNIISGDFLDKNIVLPDNCKVISNPPYYKINKIMSSWEKSDIIENSKEYYAAFMEKIIKQSDSSVLITPFSFVGGDKFYSLRLLLNDYNGFIFSFDNIPGNIFKGKKKGIFNTNTKNSVRVAITVVENNKKDKGFRISPLLRFSTEEREKLLNKEILSSYLSEEYQIISDSNKKYSKCFKELELLYKQWKDKSDKTLNNLLDKDNNSYIIVVPNTCRYYVVATEKDLNRTGKIELHFKDKESMEYAYVLLNSSFAYLYWRIYDGSITYPEKLLKSLPVFINLINDEYKKEIHNIVYEMIKKENDYLVYKKNASELQENVKFPLNYRDKLNKIMLEILDINLDIREFDRLHNNYLFKE